MNRTIAIFAFAASVTSMVVTASASTFEISGSGNPFTIKRIGDTSSAETVRYRTVPLSAFPGQHYTSASGTLEFAPLQTSTNVSVAVLTPDYPTDFLDFFILTPEP